MLQIQLTGFLHDKAPIFCKEFWQLCLSAQASPNGVPKELVEAKKAELKQEKVNLLLTTLSKLTSHPSRSRPKRQPPMPDAVASNRTKETAKWTRFVSASAASAASDLEAAADMEEMTEELAAPALQDVTPLRESTPTFPQVVDPVMIDVATKDAQMTDIAAAIETGADRAHARLSAATAIAMMAQDIAHAATSPDLHPRLRHENASETILTRNLQFEIALNQSRPRKMMAPRMLPHTMAVSLRPHDVATAMIDDPPCPDPLLALAPLLIGAPIILLLMKTIVLILAREIATVLIVVGAAAPAYRHGMPTVLVGAEAELRK